MKLFALQFASLLRARKNYVIAGLSIVVLLCCSIVSFGQPFNKAKLDELFSLLDEKHKAMGNLLLLRNDSVIYDRRIGFSVVNSKEQKPINEKTRFRIGSVSKMFTSTMMLQLVEENKIQLTTTLDKFFPEIPNASQITIAHVLSHRSGIHDIFNDASFKRSSEKPKTDKDLLKLLAKAPSDFDPGSNYAYSNVGFVVLGFVIEKVTGQSYAENLNARIASKIGLAHTYVAQATVDTSNNEAYSYRYLRDWEQVESRHMSVASAAGGLISTAKDLTHFIQQLFSGKLIKAETLKEMIANKYGMDEFLYNGKTFYGHSGGIDNFGTMLMFLPEENLAVAYMTNAKVFPVAQIMETLFAIYYNKTYKMPDFDGLQVDTDLLDKYVGVYSSSQAPVKFTITREGNKLFIRAGNETAAPLLAVTEDRFKIENAPVEFRFDLSKDVLIIIRAGGERVFNKEK